jgi:AcrR family transcriptional regulator
MVSVNMKAKKNPPGGSAASAASPPYHHGDLRRSLLDAALELLAEEQAWTFSLREVARRAGVSHNAPYNHFVDKRDLLAAIAVSGFHSLRDRMRRAIARTRSPETALIDSGLAYVHFGLSNPALYRLMFGPELTLPPGLPQSVKLASGEARAVLEQIVLRGARASVFTPSAEKREQLEAATLSCWSAVHGLTLLAIDGRVDAPPSRLDRLAAQLTQTMCYGLVRRKATTRPACQRTSHRPGPS